MTGNNTVLNRLFTQNVFNDLIENKFNSTYYTIVKRYISNPDSKSNGELISAIYKLMSKNYRNEYFYLNTLLNKLLLGKHSPKTTTALTQIEIAKSKADFILINGKAAVYEIKSDLDNFERLKTQLSDYYKAFNNVSVVTSVDNFKKISDILENSNVGIYALTKNGTISTAFKKEPLEDNSCLDHNSIFKVLYKREFENILLSHFKTLPNTSPVFYYDKCLDMFSQIPILEVYALFLRELKNRNQIMVDKFKMVPYELKSLMYFSNPSTKEYEALYKFLNKKYWG